MTDVLVVDDDPGMRDTLSEILNELGYEVATAPDGAAALGWLSEHPPPGVVLLDWMMPRCGAVEFRERQRKDPRIRDVPVVLLTADMRLDEKRTRLQVDAYARKPISLAKLVELVDRYARKQLKPSVSP